MPYAFRFSYRDLKCLSVTWNTPKYNLCWDCFFQFSIMIMPKDQMHFYQCLDFFLSWSPFFGQIFPSFLSKRSWFFFFHIFGTFLTHENANDIHGNRLLLFGSNFNEKLVKNKMSNQNLWMLTWWVLKIRYKRLWNRISVQSDFTNFVIDVRKLP